MAMAFQSDFVALEHDHPNAKGLIGIGHQLFDAPGIFVEPPRILVEFQHPTVFFQYCGISAKPHATAIAIFLQHVPLGLLYAYDFPLGFFIEFLGGRLFDPRNIAGIFDDGQLQSITQTQIGNIALTGIANGLDDPFATTTAKGPRNDDTIESIQIGQFRFVAFKLMTVNPGDIDPSIPGHAGVSQRLIDRDIGIGELKVPGRGILANHGHLDLVARLSAALDQFLPMGPIGCFFWLAPQFAQNLLAQTFFFQYQRDIVDRLRIWGRNNVVVRHISANLDLLFAHLVSSRLSSTYDKIGENAVFTQHADSLLGWLGLHFANMLRYGHVGDQRVHEMFLAQIALQGLHSKEKGLIFIIAHGAANLD